MRESAKNAATWLLVIAGAAGVPFAWQLGKANRRPSYEPRALAALPPPSVSDFTWFRILPDGSVDTETEGVDVGMLGEGARDALPEVMIGYAAKVENRNDQPSAFDLVISAERLWRGEWQRVDQWRVTETLKPKESRNLVGKLRTSARRITTLDRARVTARVEVPAR